MSTKTTPFQGTKFYLQTGVSTGKAITKVTTTSPVTLTITGNALVAGDTVSIIGLGTFNGVYPVKSVSTDIVTLCDEVDWTDNDLPVSYTEAKASKVIWSENFCAIKNLSKDADTLSEEDITTMDSDGTETEPGEITFGALKLTFFYVPADELQRLLRDKFHKKETFAYKIVFKNNQGSATAQGFISESPSYSGEVKGKFESGVTIKQSKRDYYLEA